MLKLHTLQPLLKKRKRIGRGGSRGGTSGKGHKGQKARSGGSVAIGFEGGQMPLFRRLPKRGFSNMRFKKDIQIIKLSRIEEIFDEGTVITKSLLIEKNAIKRAKSKGPFILKILADGKLNKKLIIEADKFSETALQAIKDIGGEARLTKEI